MRSPVVRPTLLLAGAVVAGLLVLPSGPATADPATLPAVPDAVQVREQIEPVAATTASLRQAQRNARRAASEGEGAGFGTELVMPTSYPVQPDLAEPDPEPLGEDASVLSGVLAHSDLAPMVNDWMDASNLVSAQVVGTSVQGRDLYLVTLTAPETTAETAQQNAWKDEIRNDPVAAAADTALQAGYKTPIWFSANIHGNEWEGTDGIMGYIDGLLTDASTPAVQTLMAEHRLYFYLTINPDGRTIGQRPGVLGLDINRDMITSTTPESIAFAKVAQAVQPLYSADLHGYTNVLQVEPCGPPHGDNYEYDLFIGHGYAAALQVEQEMLDAVIPGNPLPLGQITIPYRDTPSGWDDYPPVFTAQYTAYYGAVTSTVELPLPRAGTTQTPVTAALNTAVAAQTITSLVDYVSNHDDEMLDNQIEVFRRGKAGAPKVQLTSANIAAVPGPAEWKPLWDVADDQNPVEYPRAYVIPVGDTQRSRTDADRVVRHLLFNDIEVGTLDAAATVGGTTYPAGSYVVDLHQPLRGLANALLDVGYDISDKVPSMYDVSAWSYSSLWGATVDRVGVTTDAPIGAATPITEPTPVPALAGAAVDTTFDLAGVPDYRALNDLLEQGGDVRMAPDGSVVVSYASFAEAVAATAAHDVPLRAATPAEVTAAGGTGARTLTDLRVGYVGTQEDTLGLTELGFDDLVPLTGTGITAASLATIDVLWVSSALGVTPGTAGDTALKAWVDAGHSILGEGTAALNAAEQYGLLSATATTGTGDANGIVTVDAPAGSPLEPYEQAATFIYPAISFTDLGAGTSAAETYGTGTPFLAGHWTGTGTAGPEYAAGKAAAVNGSIASGARALVFGTPVFFRTHVKGGISQAGRALFWGASAPATPLPEAPAKPATSTTITQVGRTTYPDGVRVRVAVAAATGTPGGQVEVKDAGGATIASGDLSDGQATFTLPPAAPGSQVVTASYAEKPSFGASASQPLTVVTRKVRSLTRTTVTQLSGPRIRVRTTVTAARSGIPRIGDLLVRLDGEQVRSLTLKRRDDGVVRFVLRLPAGRHTLQAFFRGNPVLLTSRSGIRKVSPQGS